MLVITLIKQLLIRNQPTKKKKKNMRKKNVTLKNV